MNEKIARTGKEAGPFQKAGGLVTASLDFDSYFPSLNTEKCANIAKDYIEKSSVSVMCDNTELALKQ